MTDPQVLIAQAQELTDRARRIVEARETDKRAEAEAQRRRAQFRVIDGGRAGGDQ